MGGKESLGQKIKSKYNRVCVCAEFPRIKNRNTYERNTSMLPCSGISFEIHRILHVSASATLAHFKLSLVNVSAYDWRGAEKGAVCQPARGY